MRDSKTQNSKPETAKRLADRDEDTYVIEAAAKMLKVFEAMEGRNNEPVNIARLIERTGFSRDFCRRAAITLKKSGWAKQLVDPKDSLFTYGPKAENFAKRYMQSLLARQS
jgi:DNA-binding IclR family transcriptional regulator